MANDADLKPPVEVIPSVQGGISAIGSAQAPLLYFESAPVFGSLNGIVQITLDAQRIFPTTSGESVANDRVIVAHLRMNIPAALSSKTIIDGALLLANPGLTQTKN